MGRNVSQQDMKFLKSFMFLACALTALVAATPIEEEGSTNLQLRHECHWHQARDNAVEDIDERDKHNGDHHRRDEEVGDTDERRCFILPHQ